MDSTTVLRATRAALLTALLAPGALAHDFWIRPSRFRAEPGARIEIGLFVGDDKETEEVPRKAERILRFEAVDGERTAPIEGEDGAIPAGVLVLGQAGFTTAVYRTNHSYIELAPDVFASYLREEGLDEALAERARRGEMSIPGKESYSRCCKVLVRAGDGAAGFDREVGLPLELVAMTSPAAWRPGEPVELRLELDGAPAAGRLVRLVHLDDREVRVAARTDEQGRVRLSPPKPGPYRAATVSMRRASDVRGDWESLWASLTFELPEPAGGSGAK